MTKWPSPWGWCRILVLAAGAVFLAFRGWDDVEKLLRLQPLGIDFLPMWAAAREMFLHPSRVYDFAALTRFQHPLLAGFHGLRPFVYPPTALLIFAPFAIAPFALANLVWTGVWLFVLLVVMGMLVKSPRVLILAAMTVTPASVLVLVTGQVTFLIAAMTLTALVSLKARPLLAGVLFGLAAVIKPQALVVLPVALFALGQWRAIAATAVTAIAAFLISVSVFGLDAWLQWITVVPRFEHWVLNAYGLRRGMITPTALAETLHLDPGATIVWRLAFGIGALVMAWTVFRATEDPARRLTALLGGSLFITPYAMHYDAALVAPAAALMLTWRPAPIPWLVALVATAMLCCAAIPQWGAAGLIGFVLVAALTPENAFAGRFATQQSPQTSAGEAAA